MHKHAFAGRNTQQFTLFCNLNMSLFLSIDFDFIKRIGSNVINQLDPEIDVIYKQNTVMLNLAFLASFSVFSTNKKCQKM